MSTNSDDPSVVELALELSGLSITVRGSPGTAADFVRRVSDLRQPPTNHIEAGSAHGSGRAPASEAASRASSTRASILESFAPCPQRWISAAGSSLRAGSSRLSPTQRANRAWLAGQWARAVINHQVATPNSTESIDLGNRFWVVLRCENCRVPRIFTTSGAFWSAIVQLEGTDCVTHAFPSETEARIYLDSAGFEVSEYN